MRRVYFVSHDSYDRRFDLLGMNQTSRGSSGMSRRDCVAFGTLSPQTTVTRNCLSAAVSIQKDTAPNLWANRRNAFSR
jgi:hypothetical protein